MSAVLYVVHFSDDRIKVGITGRLRERMRRYEQEARRNRVGHLTWWACAPVPERGTALLMERVLCGALKEDRLPQHREWLEGGPPLFRWVIEQAEKLRQAVASSEESVADLPAMGAYGHVRMEAA